MLLLNIHQLLQIRTALVRRVAGKEMAELPLIRDAYLLVEDGRIADFGPMSYAPTDYPRETIDCTGRLVLPAWVDSHTHLVYAGDRSGEWVDRLRGKTYAEIAAAGGGILNSARRLNATPEDALYEQSKARLDTLIRMGTATVEIKSGYGLTLEGELKMLRVIRRLRETSLATVRATFLGAHAVPAEYTQDREGYLRLLTEEMLPAIAAEGLADFVDVFCEEGYFSVEDTVRIVEAAAKHGLPAKLHVNQFTALGGVRAAVEHGVLSVDHLEVLTDDDIAALQSGRTTPVALPGCSFFLGIPYTPGRRLIEAGLPLAIATDYNPGSAPSGSMHLAVSLACTQMKLLPAEAINAATFNAAAALGVEWDTGSITVGKRADLIVTKPLPDFAAIPYHFGMPLVERVILNGTIVK